MNRTPRAITAGLLAALALAGCSGDPDPEIADPSPSPTAETSEPEAPTPPELPPEAESKTEVGARSFVEHYWDVANYAQSTGDTKGLDRISADTCGGCDGAISFVRSVYSAGGTIEGGTYSVKDLELTELRADEARLFDCEFRTQNTRQVVRRPDKKRIIYPASTVAVQFTVSFGPDGWQVDRWDVP